MNDRPIQHPEDPEVRALTYRIANRLVISVSISGEDDSGYRFGDTYDWGDTPLSVHGDSRVELPYFSGEPAATEAESLAAAVELMERYQAHLNRKLDLLRELLRLQAER